MSKKTKQLEAEGLRIWGSGWQTKLAAYLECDPRTVRRMMAGEAPIKQWLFDLLEHKRPERTP